MSTFPVLLNPAGVGSSRPSRSLSVSWAPALCGVLFVACTSTTFMGGAHSQAIIGAIWQGLFGHWHFEAVGPVNLAARKVGHFIGHGMLSLVFRNTWYTVVRRVAPQQRASWIGGSALLAVLTTMAIASMDELHQMFVPGRVGCTRDVIIDTAGAFAANLLFFTLRMQRRRTTRFDRRDTLSVHANG